MLVAALAAIDLWLAIPVIIAQQLQLQLLLLLLQPWAAMAVAGGSSAMGALIATFLRAHRRGRKAFSG